MVRKFEGVELCEWETGFLARDLEIARWLKFERLEKIRDIIRRNAKELNDYGFLTTAEENSADEKGRGRPATVYYLNKEQALVVAMLSRASGAAEVRKILTRAFDASLLAATDSFIFNKLFLKEPQHTAYLWTANRLGPIARLPLARRAQSSRDFIDSLRHEYEGRALQMGFAPLRALKPPKKGQK